MHKLSAELHDHTSPFQSPYMIHKANCFTFPLPWDAKIFKQFVTRFHAPYRSQFVCTKQWSMRPKSSTLNHTVFAHQPENMQLSVANKANDAWTVKDGYRCMLKEDHDDLIEHQSTLVLRTADNVICHPEIRNLILRNPMKGSSCIHTLSHSIKAYKTLSINTPNSL